MSDDISHDRAIYILKELEKISGFPYDYAKKMYRKNRDKGFSRGRSVREVWGYVMNEDFEIEYENEEGWGDDEDEYMSHDILTPSKIDWFFGIMSDMTGYDKDDIQREYLWQKDYLSEVLGSKSPKDYYVMRLTWNSIMDERLLSLMKTTFIKENIITRR